MALEILITQARLPGPIISLGGDTVRSETLVSAGTSTIQCDFDTGGIVQLTATGENVYYSIDQSPDASQTPYDGTTGKPRGYLADGDTVVLEIHKNQKVAYIAA